MIETEKPGVEHLPACFDDRRESRAPIDGIADHGMSRRCEVHADLVRPPRAQTDRDERCPFEALERPIVSDRALARFAPASDAAPPVSPIRDERRVEGPRSPDAPFDEREVLPLDRVRPELLLQVAKGVSRPREDERSGSLPVQAMHDPDPAPPSVAVPKVVERTGKESVLLVLRGLHGQEARRFVHDQEERVFGEDREPGPDAPRGRPVRLVKQRDLVVDFGARLVGDAACGLHSSGSNRVAGGPAREAETPRDREVEPHGAGRPAGTRIWMKKPGSPIRGLDPAPGPNSAAGRKRERT